MTREERMKFERAVKDMDDVRKTLDLRVSERSSSGKVEARDLRELVEWSALCAVLKATEAV